MGFKGQVKILRGWNYNITGWGTRSDFVKARTLLVYGVLKNRGLSPFLDISGRSTEQSRGLFSSQTERAFNKPTDRFLRDTCIKLKTWARSKIAKNPCMLHMDISRLFRESLNCARKPLQPEGRLINVCTGYSGRQFCSKISRLFMESKSTASWSHTIKVFKNRLQVGILGLKSADDLQNGI
jgi:hypothetical protein